MAETISDAELIAFLDANGIEWRPDHIRWYPGAPTSLKEARMAIQHAAEARKRRASFDNIGTKSPYEELDGTPRPKRSI